MRRDLVDKITEKVSGSSLFATQSLFPRRYFDDLVLE